MKSIAIIVPAFNAERTLADCIHSVRIQTRQAYLIVVDDCSSDRTGLLAQKADLVVRNACRMGKAKSVNTVVSFIQHEYVLVLDADTYLERRFIEKLQKALEGHDYALGSGFATYIGRNKFSKKIAKLWSGKSKDAWRFNGCCQFFKTELLRQEGYDEECLVEDEEIFWRLQDKKGVLVDAKAYSETPLTPRVWIKQQHRWARGQYQLVRRNFTRSLKHKYKSEILHSILLPILLILWWVYGILSQNIGITTIAVTWAVIFLLIASLFGFSFLKYFHYQLLFVFLPLYSFFEILVFNRKLKVTEAW